MVKIDFWDNSLHDRGSTVSIFNYDIFKPKNFEDSYYTLPSYSYD